jgi:hypothetical protein
MKSSLTLLALLGLLFNVACNTDMQKEESGPEESRDDYRENSDNNVTTPVDDRPELEEEMNN